MIFMPPRHGKSELASRRFPAWYLGNFPDRSLITASYNSDLATDFGREVRNIVASPEYARLFPSAFLASDSKAANRWHTAQGGSYVAAGVGTSVTGRGAHNFLIDDPIKDRDEADSETVREKVWRWYTSTAYTRLEGSIDADLTEDDDLWLDFLKDIEQGDAEPYEGGIALIQTRWNDDDLAGRLLEAQEQGADQWEVLELPALNQYGDALWPEKFGVRRLESIKRAIGPRDWSALYQQRPAPDEGLYFKREWIQEYDELPKHVHKYGASDYAVTADGGDFTVHGVAAVDEDDNLYIEDWWRGQTESDVWIERVIDLMALHKPLQWGEENGQIIKSIGPFLAQRMNERRVYCSREQYASAADKPTRARSFQARMSMGKVFFKRGAPWLPDLISELLMFPAGKNDDQVDVLSLFGRMLDEMIGGRPAKSKQDQEDRWDKAFRKKERSNRKSYKVL